NLTSLQEATSDFDKHSSLAASLSSSSPSSSSSALINREHEKHSAENTTLSPIMMKQIKQDLMQIAAKMAAKNHMVKQIISHIDDFESQKLAKNKSTIANENLINIKNSSS